MHKMFKTGFEKIAIRRPKISFINLGGNGKGIGGGSVSNRRLKVIDRNGLEHKAEDIAKREKKRKLANPNEPLPKSYKGKEGEFYNDFYGETLRKAGM